MVAAAGAVWGAAAMSASGKKARRRVRPPDERLAHLDGEIARVTTREERRLIRVARQAGLFGRRIPSARIGEVLEGLVRDGGHPLSSLAKLRAQADRVRGRQAASARSDDARRKAILGGFLVAQFRHRPGLMARMRPDIEGHLRSHRSEAVAQANLALVTAFLDRIAGGGPEVPAPETGAGDTGRATRDRARRQIPLGAWLLARRDAIPALDGLVREELGRFLERDRRAGRRNAALLADMLVGGGNAPLG